MTSRYPRLNLPPIKLKVRKGVDTESLQAWDSLRGCFLVLTPEEWVRQHFINYLVNHHKVEALQIIQEYAVDLNNQPQRADIVVVDREQKAQILIECKAPEVRISQQTFAQAVRYNSVVGARYIFLTNGLTHHCFEHREEGYIQLKSFPENLAQILQ
ncbi:MAG: type I restriction enzyme HsdR N-terminal domain-containing protein [Rikenellaceae bacterium]